MYCGSVCGCKCFCPQECVVPQHQHWGSSLWDRSRTEPPSSSSAGLDHGLVCYALEVGKVAFSP